MIKIHPTAIIDINARLGENNEIGPFCRIGENVILGDNCILDSNVVIDGNTTIGSGNRFFHSAVIGTEPQDLKYNGEPTKLIIGNNNTIREFVTINRSATLDEPTMIGDNNLLMAYAHIAHNCRIGSNVIIANAVNPAGHVHIGDFVTIGGMTAISQFVKIGAYSFVGGKSGITKDIPPFTRGVGFPYKVVGLNSIGLQRKGFSKQQIDSIKQVFRLFYYSEMNVSQALEKTTEISVPTAEQKFFIDFIKNSERGICK